MPPAQITRRHREQLYALDRRSSAVPQIYDRLRQLIVELRLRPGESLSKAELAKRFGISETPVREALLRLEEEGLVVIKPQSGTYVALIDVERAAEARFLRLSVEIEVVKNLCRGLNGDQLGELRSILTHQHFLCEASDRAAFSREDSAFHMAMYRMAGVGGLWRNVRSMRAHLTRLRMLDIPQPGTMKWIICEHEAIFEAIGARDAVAGETAVRRHLSGTVAPIETLRSKYPDYFQEIISSYACDRRLCEQYRFVRSGERVRQPRLLIAPPFARRRLAGADDSDPLAVGIGLAVHDQQHRDRADQVDRMPALPHRLRSDPLAPPWMPARPLRRATPKPLAAARS